MSAIADVPSVALVTIPIVLPILAAALALAAGARYDGSGYPIALVTTVITAVVASALTWRVFADGPVRVVLGGFDAPYGIELAVDGLSAPVALLIAWAGLAALIAASSRESRSSSFYGLYLLLLAGLSGVALTADVFNLYVFLEISGLAAYALIATGGGGRSAFAALKYLVMGTVGASLYLVGVGYAYVATGTLNMADLAVRLGDPAIAGYGDTLVLAAFAFVVVGLAIKIALFPVHTWQPDAYTEAPDLVTALIAALVSTTAAYALARVVYSVFTVEFLAATPVVRTVVLYAAAVSVVAGSAIAVLQSDVKRMLAYSSVSQFGLIVIGVFLLEHAALVGAIVQLVGHGLVKGALFLGVAIFSTTLGARTLHGLAGGGKRAPLASAGVVVLALALVGVPPSVGFVGKLYIAIGAYEAGEPILLGVIVLSTLLTLGYVYRLGELLYFVHPRDHDGSTVADGGRDETSTGERHLTADRPGRAILGVVLLAGLIAVALGFAGLHLESLLEPTVEALLNP